MTGVLQGENKMPKFPVLFSCSGSRMQRATGRYVAALELQNAKKQRKKRARETLSLIEFS
jgi:hypothetical protein